MGIFLAGFSVGKLQGHVIAIEGLTNLEAGKPAGVDFSLFWEAWSAVSDKYVSRGELDYEAMVQGAVSGMVQALEDPYSVFLNPKNAKEFLQDIAGSFEGVGMEIGVRDGQLTIIAPLDGTPAQLAGLRAGDAILKIDDTFTRSITIDEAVSLIRGPRGSTVVLSILREGWNASRDFSIERAVVQVPSLTWEMKEDGILYIKIRQFSEQAPTDFQAAVSQGIAQGAERVIVDLRNNPGGFLEVAQDLAGWFIPRNGVVTIEDFGNGQGQREYRTHGSSALSGFPTVVLMNEGSASASEILAGALRDQLGVKIVGTTSFGKGSVQELERFSDGSALKLTVAHWLTPKGTLIQGKGLDPDVAIEMTDADIDAGRDPQLDSAIEIVKGL